MKEKENSKGRERGETVKEQDREVRDTGKSSSEFAKIKSK